jgi:diguanylate cyclase (GGDEF)-like protein
MIDLDHFKQVNDTYGHLNGDAVLAELASILTTGARESDVCARYGGEEFALILGETTEAGARTLAERIRTKVAAATFPGGLRLTISIGVAATDQPALFTSLIERADQALYAAKQGGRNQVRVADMKSTSTRQHTEKPA